MHDSLIVMSGPPPNPMGVPSHQPTKETQGSNLLILSNHAV
jgi:hypothetical protein